MSAPAAVRSLSSASHEPIADTALSEGLTLAELLDVLGASNGHGTGTP